MNDYIGLGVAGNFTEHLEQAGEANDFSEVKAKAGAPKGIFPWFVPSYDGFLSADPSSDNELLLPDGVNVQAEPELAVIFDLEYENNKVKNMTPKAFTAFNDASLRTDKPKISLKKNWDKSSQGISDQVIEIDKFEPGGVLDNFVLACYLKRDDQWREYGEPSEVKYYSYFYQQLTDWLIDKMNNQVDHGPLEDISKMLRTAGYPKQARIAVGSTRYTPFGENTYLEKGDELAVVLYEGSVEQASYIMDRLDEDQMKWDGKTSILRQTVRSVPASE